MSSPAMTDRQAWSTHAGVPSSDVGWWIWPLSLLPPLLLMLGIAFQPWVAPGDLLRDPLAVAEMTENCCKVYFGAVSSAGVVVWSAGAAICLFAAIVLNTLGRAASKSVFMLSAGLFTGILAFDDLYLVHENVLPAFGVSQPVTYGAYGLLGLGYLALSWREILNHRFGLLAVAIVLLAISVVIDWFFHSDLALRILLEDGAKLCGIFAWTAFHAAAAWKAITVDEAFGG